MLELWRSILVEDVLLPPHNLRRPSDGRDWRSSASNILGMSQLEKKIVCLIFGLMSQPTIFSVMLG